jgi:hypothetical protein
MSQLSPLQIHTNGTLFADRALVCRLHVEVVATLVQVVPTWHGDNGGGGGEEIITTDRTIIVHGAWMAFVCRGTGYSNADITVLDRIRFDPPGIQNSYLAMVEVFA